MRYNRLGETDLRVSELCLGSMTWGEQNNEREAHAQLDCALAHGVNFIDTAEVYPVPPRAGLNRQGRQGREGRRRQAAMVLHFLRPLRLNLRF